ncbi:MAG TPA: hypothetical protein VF655_04955 [Allosphingosinicella sp.]
MRRALVLLSSLLLAGCAGYAADYLKPKGKLIAPHLPRYGLTGAQGECVEAQLTKSLSVWQLRQLGDLAGRLVAGGNNPAVLGSRDLLRVAGLVEDSKVEPETRKALAACQVAPQTAAQPVAVTTSVASPATSQPSVPAPSPSVTPLWVNLGAARTGQGIAVDAASVTRGPSWRQAWFRLLNTDQANVGDIGYLLRIECASRVITAYSGRKYAADGTLAEQKDYPSPEGPMPVEPGTVIEVAYHALCDDPR